MVHGISLWRAYAFAWITLGLFVFSLIGHWLFGWFAYADEQTAHGQPIEVDGYTIQMLRDTLENWQSEFLQLLWQVGGLALFLHLGSPQAVVAILHWPQFLSLFGAGGARFSLELKHVPLPGWYLGSVMLGVLFCGVLPYAEELLRTLHAEATTRARTKGVGP
jgi:hypothetical protein